MSSYSSHHDYLNTGNRVRALFFLIALFFLGFNIAAIYVPICCFALIYGFKSVYVATPSKRSKLFAFFFLFFVLTTFVIGFERMTHPEPLRLLFVIVFSVFFLYLSLIPFGKRWASIAIGFYAAGVFAESAAVVVFSYLKDSSAYGYGLVISPFSGEEINSPSVSNLFCLVFCYFFLMLSCVKKIYSILICFVFVVGSVFCALFLGGRTFFILAALTFVFSVSLQVGRGKLAGAAVLFCVVCGVALGGYYFGESLGDYIDVLIERSEYGLESNRFEHVVDGMAKLLAHPFGGYEVNKRIEYTNWFHNIVLDVGRLAGWLPLFFLFSACFLVFSRVKPRLLMGVNYLHGWMFLVTLLLLLQDVIVEGSVRPLVFFFAFSIALLERDKSFRRAS